LEISSIGCEEAHNKNDIKGNLNGNISEQQVPLDAEVEGSEKELEDYPRPQAVVAASVLYVSSPYPTKLHVYNAFNFKLFIFPKQSS